MKRISAFALVVCLAAAPVPAQEAEKAPPDGDMTEGLSLLERGARLFMKGLADEMEPAMRKLAENVEPAMKELLRLVDDFNAYEMPEMLPNGDIIIRRKPDHPLPAPEDGQAPGGAVEL